MHYVCRQMLDKLERKLGRFAIPNLTLYLVGGQAAAWVLSVAKPEFFAGLVLVPALVMQGEVWRLVSFLFTPRGGGFLGPIGVIFALLMLFFFGRALEEQWGTFRYNVFLFIGWLATIAAASLAPLSVATNIFLLESVMLAFALLYPNYEILLLVLPVKVKWLAALILVQFGYVVYQSLRVGDLSQPALVGAAMLNLALFFGPEYARRLRGRSRRVGRPATASTTAKAKSTAVRHKCEVCGLTDVDDPDMQFRYCSQCEGKRGYCADHLRAHEHVK